MPIFPGGKSQPSIIDIYAPIDLQQLVEETRSNGPVRIRKGGEEYGVSIRAHPCPCGDKDCSEIVVVGWHNYDDMPIILSFNAPDLDQFNSLDELADAITFEPHFYFQSFHERQEAEQCIQETTGLDLPDLYGVEDIGFYLERIDEKIGFETPIEQTRLLLLLWEVLREHNDLKRYANETLQQLKDMPADEASKDLAGLLERAYDLGFLTARLKDNFQVDVDIAPAARRGLKAKEAQTRRAKTGGAATASKANAQRAKCQALVAELAALPPPAFCLLPIEEQARRLRTHAAKTCPKDFRFKGNKMLSEAWFLRQLEDMQADGILAGMCQR